MKTVALGFVAGAAALSEKSAGRLVNDVEFISEVNKRATTWTAAPSTRFENMTLADAKRLMGVHLDRPTHKASKARLAKWDLSSLRVEDIPDTFDVRTAFPSCTDITSHIYDQSACGSCWAVSSTSVFSDRNCIAKNGTVILSGATTNACCNFFGGCYGSSGCDGGEPSDAWNYFVNTGVPTGGDYGSTGNCWAYSFPPCSHHVTSPLPACPTNEYSTPACPIQSGDNNCPDTAYGKTFQSDARNAISAYSLDSVTDAQTDIMLRGSIVAAFTVYEDFVTYKTGVYQWSGQGEALGGHAVSIIGWGVENGTPYWLVRNSWNKYWGDNGLFKILRGQDECGIEDDLVAGQV